MTPGPSDEDILRANPYMGTAEFADEMAAYNAREAWFDGLEPEQLAEVAQAHEDPKVREHARWYREHRNITE